MTDLAAVKRALAAQRIETPSWAFGNSGTRFKVFAQPGVPRTPQEKIADAAQVHAYTGIAPIVSLHIPWDRVDDYRLGSVTTPDPAIRRKALRHLLDCVDIMDATGSRDLKLWFSDGTNYPGQDDIRARQDRLRPGATAACA